MVATDKDAVVINTGTPIDSSLGFYDAKGLMASDFVEPGPPPCIYRGFSGPGVMALNSALPAKLLMATSGLNCRVKEVPITGRHTSSLPRRRTSNRLQSRLPVTHTKTLRGCRLMLVRLRTLKMILQQVLLRQYGRTAPSNA